MKSKRSILSLALFGVTFTAYTVCFAYHIIPEYVHNMMWLYGMLAAFSIFLYFDFIGGEMTPLHERFFSLSILVLAFDFSEMFLYFSNVISNLNVFLLIRAITDIVFTWAAYRYLRNRSKLKTFMADNSTDIA